MRNLARNYEQYEDEYYKKPVPYKRMVKKSNHKHQDVCIGRYIDPVKQKEVAIYSCSICGREKHKSL